MKKVVYIIKNLVKLITLLAIAACVIIGILFTIYKPTYSVSFNDELIGYTRNKSELQARINSAITNGDNENVAFVEIENMPKYKLCMVNKNVSTNDEEIYNKIINQGTTYYRYFALAKDGEEKYNFSTFETAEDVVNQLKEKDSANVDKLTIIEKYNTENATYAEVESAVSELYEKKIVKPVVKVAKSGSTGIGVSGMNDSDDVVSLGVSLIRPTSGTITSRFGSRSRDNHKGLDIGAPQGTPIYAAASGTVTTAQYGYGGGYGNYIIISHGNGVQTLYGHCSSLCVEEGAYVEQGELIAKVGSTGISTGNHLHLEVRVNGVAQNPQNYVY